MSAAENKELRAVEHCYYRFNFHCAYHCDEKQEEIYQHSVDMSTGRQDDVMEDLLLEIEGVLPLRERQYVLPIAPVIPHKDAYRLACAAVKSKITNSMEKSMRL